MLVGRDDPVRHLLRRPTVQVHHEDALRSVAEMLTEESIGVVVVKGTRPPGLVSERDIVRALAEGADPDEERAGDVMTEELAMVSPDATVLDVVTLMLANEIRHVPVIEDDVVIGVVSVRDALAALAGSVPGTDPTRP